MKKVFFVTFFIFFSFKVFSLEVTLTQGSVKPTPIAVTELYSKNSQLTKVGKNISTVISDNLERSGLFLPIDKKYSFLDRILDPRLSFFYFFQVLNGRRPLHLQNNPDHFSTGFLLSLLLMGARSL